MATCNQGILSKGFKGDISVFYLKFKKSWQSISYCVSDKSDEMPGHHEASRAVRQSCFRQATIGWNIFWNSILIFNHLYFDEKFASMFQTKIVKIQVPYNKNAPLEIFCEVFSPVKRGKQTSSSMPNESGNLLTTESAR